MIRVALADDHHQVREIWHFILSSNAAFEVVAKCSNGREAVEAAQLHYPDIFLMDINMQPMNGIDATEIILQTLPGVKVIGMSMHAEMVYVKRMLQAGAQGYVTKNSPYEEVFRAILEVNAGQQYLCQEIENRMPGLAMAMR